MTTLDHVPLVQAQSEASFEFLVGGAGKMIADDHAQQLALVGNELDHLKTLADQINHEIHAQGADDNGFFGEIGESFGDDGGASNSSSPIAGGPSAIDYHHMPAEDAHALSEVHSGNAFNASTSASGGSLFEAMLEYFKMAQHDARDDHKIARDDQAHALVAADAHLHQDNQAIDQGMQEAGQKADIAMHSAWTGMVTGIVNGAVQIGGGAAAASSDTSHTDQSGNHDSGGLPHFELVAISDTSHHWPL